MIQRKWNLTETIKKKSPVVDNTHLSLIHNTLTVRQPVSARTELPLNPNLFCQEDNKNL